MGLLSNLFNAAKSRPAQRIGAVDINPWSMPTPTRQLLIESDNAKKAYIYDHRPLVGVRVGQEIIVEAFRGKTKLISTITGYENECGDGLDIALMYNGVIFGSARIDTEKVKLAAEHGYALMFRARADGLLPEYGNILNLNVYCPQKLILHGLIPDVDDRPLAEREYVFTYNLYKPEEFVPLATRDKWQLDRVTLEFLPVPKGSKAKPHIAVRMEDGTIISDVSANRPFYKSLVEFMKTYSSFKLTAERVCYDDENVRYKLMLFGE